MKGIRFYQDDSGCGIKLRGWKKSFPNGFNGLAVAHEQRLPSDPSCAEAIGSLYFQAGDGPYCETSVCLDYISEHCRRISEAKAHKFFPELIRRLS
jgi:hypothetical protein